MVARGNSCIRAERLELLAGGFVFLPTLTMSHPSCPDPDHQRVAFHVQKGDCLVTMAPVLDLVRRNLEKRRGISSDDVRPQVSVTKDLLFLHTYPSQMQAFRSS